MSTIVLQKKIMFLLFFVTLAVLLFLGLSSVKRPVATANNTVTPTPKLVECVIVTPTVEASATPSARPVQRLQVTPTP